MALKKLGVTKKQWQSKYTAAKKEAHRNLGMNKVKRNSQYRLRLANDLKEARAGKRYEFKK